MKASAKSKSVIRYKSIGFVYLLTAIVGGASGLAILLAPNLARKMVGFPRQLPEQDPIMFGFVGAIWLAVALISLLGLKAPLKFLPLLFMQLVYKCIWFLFVFAPLAYRGEYPLYGLTCAIGNALWIAFDLRAIPFRYLFADQRIRQKSLVRQDTAKSV